MMRAADAGSNDQRHSILAASLRSGHFALVLIPRICQTNGVTIGLALPATAWTAFSGSPERGVESHG
jgi:hypothetical protein